LGEWHRACWRRKTSVKKVVERLGEPGVKGEVEPGETA
jgi:hypothetical protein